MYNPYLEEVFVPVDEGDFTRGREAFSSGGDFRGNPSFSQSVGAKQSSVGSLEGEGFSSFVADLKLEDMEEKLSTLQQLGKWKEMWKPEYFSFVGDLFRKKKGEGADMDEVSQELEKQGFFSGLKEKLHLEKLDTGDVLLIIIVIYLMLEGEDTLELAITLGILAFFWWSDSKKEGVGDVLEKT